MHYQVGKVVQQHAVHLLAAAQLPLGLPHRGLRALQLPVALAERRFLARQLVDHVPGAAHDTGQTLEARHPRALRRQEHSVHTTTRCDRLQHRRRLETELFRHRGEPAFRHPQERLAVTVRLWDDNGHLDLTRSKIFDVELEHSIGGRAEPTNGGVQQPTRVDHEAGDLAHGVEQVEVGDLARCPLQPGGPAQQLRRSVTQRGPIVPMDAGASIGQHVPRDRRPRQELVQVQQPGLGAVLEENEGAAGNVAHRTPECPGTAAQMQPATTRPSTWGTIGPCGGFSC